jgi:hypothetical protein
MNTRRAVAVFGQVADVQGDQFAAPQRGGVADQQQRAVAACPQRRRRGGPGLALRLSGR